MTPETAQNENPVNTEEYYYDANARQSYPFEITENDGVYETVHNYEPLTDERYLQFVRGIKVKGNEDQVFTDTISASEKLWNDLVSTVDNFETDAEDWKSVIDFENEKEPSLQTFLAVAVVEPENTATGIRRKSVSDTQKVVTEAYFNGRPVKQLHELKRKTTEWSKKFDQIQANRTRPEKIGGLRGKPNMIAVPKDQELGRLYDEMLVRSEGFADNNIPLRFKVTVMNYVFRGNAKLNEKK